MIQPNVISIILDLDVKEGIKRLECLGPALTADSEKELYEIFNASVKKSNFDTSNCPKIFISKSCKIPRAKLSSLKDNKVLEVKRNIKDCDYLVVNIKSCASSAIEQDYYSFIIDISELHNIVKFELTHRYYEESKKDQIKNTFAEILNLCKTYNITKLRLNRLEYRSRYILIYKSDKEKYYNVLQPEGYTLQTFVNNFQFLNHPDRKFDKDGDVEYESSYFGIMFSNPEVQAILNSSIKVIDSSQVTKLMNSTVIDEELFENILSMLSSNDWDNINTALEVMASCDFEESLFYIVMLLDIEYQKISHSNYFKHVNFQSLVQYVKSVLELGDIDTPHRFRRTMGGFAMMEAHALELLNKGYMFPEHVSFIKKHIFPNHEVKCDFATTEFFVKTEIIDKMNKNETAKQNNNEE